MGGRGKLAVSSVWLCSAARPSDGGGAALPHDSHSTGVAVESRRKVVLPPPSGI